MKILFLNTNIGYGGASKMMVTVANHLAEKDDVTFVTFRNDKVLQKLSEKVRHVHNPLCQKKNKILELVGQISALRKYIKKEEFDIAVAFLHPSHYMLTLAAKGTKTKVLLSERSDPSQLNGNIAIRLMFKLLQTADAYVFQTKEAGEYYSKKAQARSFVIPNPIPDKQIPEPCNGDRKKIIVNVARMELKQKRHDVLIEAWASIESKYSDYELCLYGDGPDEEKIKKIVEGFGVRDRVKFKGVSRNVLEDIKDSSAFVFSSDYEGVPNALLEAMAVGLPCVSTDCSPGGARLLIDNEKNGLLVPRGDSKALAQAIERVLDEQDFAKKIGQEATKVIKDFSKERILEMWRSFIDIIGEGK